MWDALVTDVHTDPRDDVVGDPGAVLHEGNANVNLLLMAIDNGPDRMVYAGPVLSHYEFELTGFDRMTDQQWKANVLDGKTSATRVDEVIPCSGDDPHPFRKPVGPETTLVFSVYLFRVFRG